jgi:hypothetical protein
VKSPALPIGVMLLACAPLAAAATDPTQVPPVAASSIEDRLLLSADGAWLTGGSGGGGATALWSHTFAPQEAINAGAEYEQVANSHWTNGILSGSFGVGSGTPAATIYFDAHVGAGDLAQSGFHYSVITAGLLEPATEWLTLQLEERRIDVDTSHGNLPKLGLSFRVAKPLLVSVSFADTAGGNLGTRLTTVRADYTSAALNALAGVAHGQAAPAVLNLLGQIVQPAPTLNEVFAGLGTSIGRSAWQLVADYTDLSGFKRTTVTLSCTLPLN